MGVKDTVFFALSDGLGNVTRLVTEDQTIAGNYSYDRWGHSESWQVWENLPGGATNRARFKGALRLGEETELYYMRNRWYEPQSGRFLSEDPIGLSGGINQYVFADGDAVNRRDPWGLATRCRYWGYVLVDANTGQVLGVEIVDWMCWEVEVSDGDEDMQMHERGGGGIRRDPCRLATPFGAVVVDESIADRVMAFLNDLSASGFRGRVESGFRSRGDQARLWAGRASNPNPVGRTKSSHLAAFALDFNWRTMGAANQAILREVASRHGFIWGGDVPTMRDSVHFFAGTYGPYGDQPTAIAHNQAAATAGVGACPANGR